MNFETTTLTVVAVSKSADEWRQVLVDPQPFQTELRAALASIVQSQGGGKVYGASAALSLNGDQPHPAGSIARAAKKQNKHFLAQRRQKAVKATAGKVPCPKCGKPVKDTPRGWKVHNGRAHNPNRVPRVAQTAVEESVG